jgi:hypothetical protein
MGERAAISSSVILSRRREDLSFVATANEIRRDSLCARICFWGRVPEFGDRVFRVVTLDDGETVHNAFPDRGFAVRDNGREQTE